MKKYFIVSLSLIGLLISQNAFAAIAFDATSTWTAGGGVMTITIPHTIGAGANEMLFVISLSTNNDATATYNGVPMTKEVSLGVDNSRTMNLFALPNPTPGTNNIIIGSPESDLILQGAGVSYSGVLQSTVLDVTSTTATTTSLTSITGNLTTVANNTWVLFAPRFVSGTNGIVAGASSTLRFLSTALTTAAADTNAPVTSGKSVSMTVTNSNGSGGAYSIMASFAPSISTSVSTSSDVTVIQGITVRNGLTIR